MIVAQLAIWVSARYFMELRGGPTFFVSNLGFESETVKGLSHSAAHSKLGGA